MTADDLERVCRTRLFTLDNRELDDIASFARMNELERDEIEAIVLLKVEETILYGGGAAPIFVLRRVA